MHSLWVLFFAIMFAFSCFIKKKWRILIIVAECLFAIVCMMDYSVTCFRGIGFIRTDFQADTTLFTMLSKCGIPTGKKFWICIIWLLFSILFVCFKDRFLKNKMWNQLGCAMVLFGFIGLGAITTYPNEYELFRGNSFCMVSVYSKEDDWDSRDRLVLHALGATAENDTLTNSRNALEYNYARGARTFETDISFTNDGVPVLRHDWSSDLGQAQYFGWTEDNTFVPTYEQFMNAPIYGKYTPMSLLDLFEFMDKHEDVYIVTDVKIDSQNPVDMQYRAIAKVAQENHLEHVLERLVIQIYYHAMYDEVESIYPFKHVLFTLYVIGEQPKEELREYLISHEMSSVTMPVWYATPEMCNYLAQEGIKVYTHTLNTEEEVLKYYGNGVYGIYTDFFMPKDLERLHEGF